jgi:hypothetical protein
MRDPYLGKGIPSEQQFRFWQPAGFHDIVNSELVTPWKLWLFTIVELASFVISWSASCFLTINLTQSQNFAAPPHLFDPTTIGMSSSRYFYP